MFSNIKIINTCTFGTRHRLICFRYLTLEMLDDASETVAMGSNQHPLSLFDLRDNLLIPVRQSPGDSVL